MEKPRGLTTRQVLDILNSPEPASVMAKKYGVGRSLIIKTRNGKCYWTVYRDWKGLPDDAKPPRAIKASEPEDAPPEGLVSVKRLQPRIKPRLDSAGIDVEALDIMVVPMGAKDTAANKMLMQAWV